MPLYIFENHQTGDIKEIIQEMNDVHEYYEDNIKWDRIFTIPNAFVLGSPVDPHSATDFARETYEKKGTYGDLIDRSAELSEKRAQRHGEDPIKKASEKKWSEDRGGRRPMRKLKDLNIKI